MALQRKYPQSGLWDPSRWNQRLGRATSNREDAKTLNAHLDAITNKVLLAETYLLNRSKEITAEALKNVVLGEVEEKKMVMKVFEEHNQRMRTLVGVELCPWANATLPNII